VAERVISNLDDYLWDTLLSENGGFLHQGDGSLLAKVAQDNTTTEAFIHKVKSTHRLNETYKRFTNWAGDDSKKKNAVQIAKTLEQVFQLEVNLPYKAWYGDVPSHIEETNIAFLEKEKNRLKGGNLTDQQVEDYLTKARQFCS